MVMYGCPDTVPLLPIMCELHCIWVFNTQMQWSLHMFSLCSWLLLMHLITDFHHLLLHWIPTHWGRVTHICVGNLTIIGPNNGLLPGSCKGIIWTNAGILLIGPWGTNFSEILIGIHTFSFKKIYFKLSSAKWRPFCLGLNVLTWNQRFCSV